MSAVTRLLAGAGRVRVLAAARVRTATAGSTAALRAAATRASALLRDPGAIRSRIRDGSPRWRATVRPAVEEFVQGVPGPAELFRRTRDLLAELRCSLPSSDSFGPALRDIFQEVPRPGAGALLGGRGRDAEEALRRRPVGLLERLRRRRRGPERRARALEFEEPHGDEFLCPEADDDDDRMAAALHIAIRRLSNTRLWKSFWDAFLDYDRLKRWLLRVRVLRRKAKDHGQRPRRLPLRPARPRSTPRKLPSSSSLLRRAPMIHSVERLEWILLANVAAVAQQGTESEIQVSLSAETPPRPSVLTVSAAISGPFTTVQETYPFVAAVADSLVLLRARSEDGITAPYYVLNMISGTSTLLPLPAGAPLIPGCVGILSHAAADYVVVGLELRSPALATLHCLDSQSGSWSAVDVEVEGGGGGREWSGQGVVSHGGRIAWVDLTLGFLFWDVLGEEPGITFVPLPTGREVPAGTAGLESLRCAALCEGVLRYAEVVTVDARNISFVLLELWSYDEEERTWLRDRAVALEELWHGGELPPREVPRLALIHPRRHVDVLYVTIGSVVYAADLRHRRVVAHAPLDDIHAPPPALMSSQFVRAWMPSA